MFEFLKILDKNKDINLKLNTYLFEEQQEY